jgi:hypothetical protein
MADIGIDNDWSFEERREYERMSVNFYLRVVDLDSARLLGDVVDISMGGMKLISAAPIPAEKKFRVQMDIALGNDYQEEVFFEAHSVWSRKDLNPGLFETGFRNALSPHAAASIQRLIDMIKSME